LIDLATAGRIGFCDGSEIAVIFRPTTPRGAQMFRVFINRFSTNSTVRQHAPLALGYSLMIGGMIVVFLLIRAYGEKLTPEAAPVTSNVHVAAQAGDVGHVLLALLIIIVLARLLGNAFRLFHHPPVIGK
jgi:hypothetical protein